MASNVMDMYGRIDFGVFGWRLLGNVQIDEEVCYIESVDVCRRTRKLTNNDYETDSLYLQVQGCIIFYFLFIDAWHCSADV